MTATGIAGRLRAGLVVCGVLLASGSVTGCVNTKPSTESFAWKGPVTKGAWLRLRNVSGDFEVRSTSGDSAEVTLQIERSNAYAPEAVVKLAKSGDDVVACVLYGSNGDCRADGYKGGGSSGRSWLPFLRGHTSVTGTILVPRGVHLDVETVNGDVDVASISGDVSVTTVNGDVDVRGLRFATKVTTTNGDVTLGSDSLGGDVQVTTTNGDVDLAVPESLAAALTMQTVNGALNLAMPANITTKSEKSIIAQLGGGGKPIRLETTNGDITLRARTP